MQGILSTVAGTMVGKEMAVGDPLRYRCQPAGLLCRYRGVGESRMDIASMERHSRKRVPAVCTLGQEPA